MTDETIKLSTIGFTKISAEDFFNQLRTANVMTVIDVRLNNTSQLAGFAKANDLAFFLRSICSINYRHEPLLAPTADMLSAYRQGKCDWDAYEREFTNLIIQRKVEEVLDPAVFRDACLLCSEDQPHHCHRRLVAEYLRDRWSIPLSIRHLGNTRKRSLAIQPVSPSQAAVSGTS